MFGQSDGLPAQQGAPGAGVTQSDESGGRLTIIIVHFGQASTMVRPEQQCLGLHVHRFVPFLGLSVCPGLESNQHIPAVVERSTIKSYQGSRPLVGLEPTTSRPPTMKGRRPAALPLELPRLGTSSRTRTGIDGFGDRRADQLHH